MDFHVFVCIWFQYSITVYQNEKHICQINTAGALLNKIRLIITIVNTFNVAYEGKMKSYDSGQRLTQPQFPSLIVLVNALANTHSVRRG